MEIDKEMTELDVEGVLRKQDTHDLYCPNCQSCITQTVVLSTRKPKSSEHDEEEYTNVELLEYLIEEEEGEIIEDELDVEGVVEKQETHDLICPNCNSCITKRVILGRRNRQNPYADNKYTSFSLFTSDDKGTTTSAVEKDKMEVKAKSHELEEEEDEEAGGLSLSVSSPKKVGASYTDVEVETWEEVIKMSSATRINLMSKDITELPESPDCPNLTYLYLQMNPDLTSIPASFFELMPNLKEVDLSNTSIKSLPQSFFDLVGLQKLFLRNCQVLMEIPARIGQLHNLEMLDLKGTDIIQFPAEIGNLIKLTYLKVSFCQYTGDLGEATMVPEGALSKLTQLAVLCIDVGPEDSRWEGAVKVVIKELAHLKKLIHLKMYLPQVELLDELTASLPFFIGSSIRGFNFNVGSHMRRVMSRTPLGAEGKFQKGTNHLRYVNGEGSIPSQVKNVLRYSKALFLDRHFTVSKLSEFGMHNMENLRFCMLGECNELQTIVQGSDDDDDPVLPELQQLIIYSMKTLTSFYNTPLKDNSLCRLRNLKLHGCAQLRTIFIIESGITLVHLEEITVKDCPAVLSLITCNNSHGQIGWSFPKLRTISLHYLPEFQSIFSGLCAAPRLDRLSVYNCPNLKTISTKEIPRVDRLKVIRGEEEWWKALEWNESEWKLKKLASVFVPIRSDADLDTQLAQDPIPEPGNESATLRVPDVVPSPSQDALTLKQALKGFGTDEKVVIKVLGYRNASQRSKIKDAYQQLYKRSLIDDLRSQLSGDFGKAVELCMHDPPERDAKLVHDALQKKQKGSLSRPLAAIVEITCTTSPKHLVAVRQAYFSLFHCSVQEDMSSNLFLPCRKLLERLVTSYRSGREEVNTYMAELEAAELHEAIETRQLDQDHLAGFLSFTNVYQLRETFEQYMETYGSSIYEDLKTCKDGDLVEMVIRCIDTPEKHFAKVIRDSITGLGTDEDSLSRVIVTRAEVDMMIIREEYLNMYNSSLDDAVAENTSGDYKDFLMALLGAKV